MLHFKNTLGTLMRLPRSLFFLTIILFTLTISCNGDKDDVEDSYVRCEYEAGLQSALSYHIVLIMGQSNTFSGRGLDPEIDFPMSNLKQLGRFTNDLEIIDAIPPLDHHSSRENSIGFGLTFGNLYAQNILNADEILILVPCGLGGSGFVNDKWNKGDPLYNDAIERVNYIRENFENSELTAVLWHQGERDIDTENYGDLLSRFITEFRTDSMSPNIPFILGGMVPYWVDANPKRQDVETIIRDIPDTHLSTAFVNTRQPFVIQKEVNNEDAIHFDAKGQRELGRRYFNEFVCLLKNE